MSRKRTRQHVEYYENGSIKSIGSHTYQGIPQGLFEFFNEVDLLSNDYEKAMVSEDGYVTQPNQDRYKNEKKGLFGVFSKKKETYVPIGSLYQSEYYYGGLENLKTFYSNGNLKMLIKYKDGKKEKGTMYYENGDIQNECFYLNDKRHGVATFYDENGNMSELNFDQGELINDDDNINNNSSIVTDIDTEDVRNMKEYLLNNKTVIKLNVFEELRADFQLMNEKGNVISPTSKNLKILKEVDYDNYEDDWDKNATTYYGRIERNNSFEFNQDDFLKYLNEFIEEIDSDLYDDETSLEDFVNWGLNEYGMEFEESAGGGSGETFTAYGDDSKEYLVCNSYMHEQNVYDLEIEINNDTTETNDNKINTPSDNDEINSEELYVYSAVGCSMDYVVDGYSADKPNLEIRVYRIELRKYCAEIKEIKDGVYKVEDLIGDDHLGTLEELVEFQNNGEEIFDLIDVENEIYVYDGEEHDEPPTENEVEHVKWYSEEFFSSKDKALKYIKEELIDAKNNQTEYFSAKKHTDDSAKSILNENGENIIYDGLNFDKFNKVNGKIEGVYEKYYGGKLFSVCNYSDGLKNGVEKKLNSENIFVPFTHYIEGKQILSYSYYPSGGYLDSIKDIQSKCILKFNFMGNVPFKDKTINKLAEVRFDKTAPKDIFEHIKGVKNIFLGPRGNIVDVGKFTDGKPQDLSESEQSEIIKQIKDFECFHPNGNLIDKRSFVNGKINGEWEIFDENGILRVKSHHKNGKRNGEQIEYYLNGQIHLKSNWINNVQQGLVTTYYENGNKMKESNIVDGNYEGDQTEWWENGEVKAKRKYINDELKSEEIFSEN
ncbi:hypothetical protein N9V34_01850 [Flavobacteriaceae bacterium]|nr:hypothetical protein [Flavobacteriaceae bacterium]